MRPNGPFSRQLPALLSASIVVFAAALPAASLAAAGDTRLRDAIRSGDATAVTALVRQRADVNAREADGATPLHWAAHMDDHTSVEALLKAGAKPNVPNMYGATPLMLAAENGSAPMIERLLAAGADPNLGMPSGETPLMTAARTGRAPAVAALVVGGANINAKESAKGQTALLWALSGPHAEAARVLVEKGADVKLAAANGFTPLMMATRYNSVESVKLLLDKGASLKEQAANGVTPLHVAVLRGHIDLAKFFLDKGADPNAAGTGYTVLHYAAGKWDGVDAHDYLDAPGEWNILLGLRPAAKADIIKALIAHGANVNAILTKEPPRYGFSLVSGFAKAYTTGATPYFIAAMSADVDTMRLLAASGADTKLPSKSGSTPLMVAAGMGWMENETLANEDDYLKAVDACLELGSDINAQNTQGNTAIHGAISGGFNRVIQRLAEKGADVNLKNKRGQTALKMALGYGAAGGTHSRDDTAALLRKLGAQD
jgi:ankyrin repeat protein